MPPELEDIVGGPLSYFYVDASADGVQHLAIVDFVGNVGQIQVGAESSGKSHLSRGDRQAAFAKIMTGTDVAGADGLV